jgi:uncharacterized OB-fold protein
MTTTEDPVLARFRDGLTREKLELPRCTRCGRLVWYPRAHCPNCMSPDLDWEEQSGRGTVYSYTVNRRGHGEYADRSPYVIAYVQLAEGPRVLAHLAVPPDDARIGAPVRLSTGLTADGQVRLTFVPDTEGTSA